MNNVDPYKPVRVPTNPVSASNRPYYIYSTSVVMLLWAGIYVYLQSQGTVSTDSSGVTISTPVRFARRMYEFNVVTIILLFLCSLALVNGGLWTALKKIKR